MRSWIVALFLGTIAQAQSNAKSDADWATFGGSLAAQHYSTRKQISRSTVKDLHVIWTFQTDVFNQPGEANARAAFEASPILWNEKLYFDTPFDEIYAVSATTGKKVWSFDPKVDRNATIGIVASRGIAMWHSRISYKGLCASDRVFVATLDRRLIAVDAKTGSLCTGFGRSGTVDLSESLHIADTKWYEFTSPPTVVGDVIVLGSSVGDNQAIEVPSGAIRGFDARSGKVLWTFEPIPWAKDTKPRSGSGGAWSVISADPALGLIYVPTGSSSVDFYGVNRPGDNRDADSVVALEAATGKRVWAFQVVHHDIWDYDVAAEPLLFTFRGKIPAVAVTTKMGMVFVLDRRNGLPLYPVYERPVPRSDVAGEQTSPTQPFSSLSPLAPLTLSADDATGKDAEDKKYCHDKIAALVNKGIYTPIGLKTTLLYPGNLGGVNWGSPAFDPSTGIMYALVNSMAYGTRLVPRPGNSLSERLARRLKRLHDELEGAVASKLEDSRFRPPDASGAELDTQFGTPYELFREPLVGPSGFPCAPQPWGSLVAMDLNKGTKLWSKPLGTMVPSQKTGSIAAGGPIVTAGGLVFAAGTSEPFLRAYDARTGEEIWEDKLPAPATSTPMTFQIRDRQYLVIYAASHGGIGTKPQDYLVAYALSHPATVRPRVSSRPRVQTQPAFAR